MALLFLKLSARTAQLHMKTWAASNVNYNCLSTENHQNGSLYKRLERIVYTSPIRMWNYSTQGGFCSHCSHCMLFPILQSVYIWFIWREKQTQKHTSEVRRTFVYNIIKVFRHALLLDVIYLFICCWALMHQEEPGPQQTESHLFGKQTIVLQGPAFCGSSSHFNKHCLSNTEIHSIQFPSEGICLTSIWRTLLLPFSLPLPFLLPFFENIMWSKY